MAWRKCGSERKRKEKVTSKNDSISTRCWLGCVTRWLLHTPSTAAKLFCYCRVIHWCFNRDFALFVLNSFLVVITLRWKSHTCWHGRVRVRHAGRGLPEPLRCRNHICHVYGKTLPQITFYPLGIILYCSEGRSIPHAAVNNGIACQEICYCRRIQFSI